MNSSYRQTKMRNWLELYRVACPVCNKSGGCIINREGDTVACLRVESEVIFSRNPLQWIHRLTKKKEVKSDATYHASHKKNPDTILDTVYSCMIKMLLLNAVHTQELTGKNRGLSDEEINVRQYRSFPEKPWEIAKEIMNFTRYQSFKGFPGFYKTQYGWTFSKNDGILIPYRNEQNLIVGFQVRIDNPRNFVEVNSDSNLVFEAKVIKQPNVIECFLDGESIWTGRLELSESKKFTLENEEIVITLKKGNRYFWFSSANKPDGTSAGSPSPVHVAVPSEKLRGWEPGTTHKAEVVWITEGALKADIAADHIVKVYDEAELKEKGDTVLAVPGVNTWASVMPVLKNMEVKKVNLAFDMDSITNEQVRFQLKEFIEELKKEGYKIDMVLWNKEDGKGIDDCFLKKRFPTLRSI